MLWLLCQNYCRATCPSFPRYLWRRSRADVSSQWKICWKGKRSLPINVLAMRYMRQVRQAHEIVSLPYVLLPSSFPHGFGTLLELVGSFSFLCWSMYIYVSRLERTECGSLAIIIHIVRESREWRATQRAAM